MEQYQLSGDGRMYHFDTGPFNWYVISQQGRLTVIDAGFPGHYRVFAHGITELGYQLKDVSAIILTHAHADHMGFAERLRAATGAPVYVHPADHTAAMKPRQLPWWGLLSNAWRPYVSRMLGHAALNGVFTMPAIAKVQAIRDGEILDVPGRPHVLHVPGHTPGEVALLFPEAGVLVSGDSLVTRQLLTGAHGPPQLIPATLSHDDALSRRSLERLRELGMVTLLPGHGYAWQGVLGEAIACAEHG